MVCSLSAKSPTEGAHDQFVALFARFVAFFGKVLEIPAAATTEKTAR